MHPHDALAQASIDRARKAYHKRNGKLIKDELERRHKLRAEAPRPEEFLTLHARTLRLKIK